MVAKISVLVHDKKPCRVQRVQQLFVWRVMTHPPGVDAVRFHRIHPKRLQPVWHRNAHRSKVLMVAHSLCFGGFAVEQKSFLRVKIKMPDPEGGVDHVYN